MKIFWRKFYTKINLYLWKRLTQTKYSLVKWQRIGVMFLRCSYIFFLNWTHLFFLDNVCLRPWSFERVPNKMIRGLDNALIYTSTKEACLAACLNEVSNININFILKKIAILTIRTFRMLFPNRCIYFKNYL